MTQREAISTVIDFVASSGTEQKQVLRAGRVLEKRLAVLQQRHGRRLQQARELAWRGLQRHYGLSGMSKFQVIRCPKCGETIAMEEFLEGAMVTGRGEIRSFRCPDCKKLLAGVPLPEDMTQIK